MVLLTLSDLTASQARIALFGPINQNLVAGEVLLLDGANGSGKTTLLRVIAGLHAADRGQVKAEPFAWLGFANGLKSLLSVRENLQALAPGAAGAVATALTDWQLNPLGDVRAGELSAGQARRAALARLSVQKRALWLLDEPTVALDATATALFEAQLDRHLATGGAAVIASHLPIRLPRIPIVLPLRRPAPSLVETEW